MPVKYILTADDFGPVDFINKGIIEQVKTGTINSVHVLVNVDAPNQLKTAMLQLREAIPEGRLLDIGCHLTLTSGTPMYYQEATGKSVAQKIALTWGKMVQKNGDTYCFKDYRKFYFNFYKKRHKGRYIDAITKEFMRQIDALGELVSELNQSGEYPRFQYNSVSNHHNVFSAREELFELYVSSAKYQGRSLAIRAPKKMPKFKNSLFYNLNLSFFRFPINPVHRWKVYQLTRAFSQHRYTGDQKIEIQSPDYTDITFYKSLGSLSVRDVSNQRVTDRLRKLNLMDSRTRMIIKPSMIVEFIFHLGLGEESDILNEDVTQGYSGINRKFFDDRLVEYRALSQAKTSPSLKTIFTRVISWSDCVWMTYHNK